MVGISSLMGFSAGGGNLKYEIFTTSGNWTKPTGVEIAYAFLVGGGGSGSKSTSQHAGGGAGGECVFGIAHVKDLGSSISVIIGSGGSGATVNGPGNHGGNTTFANLTAEGGRRGEISSGGQGGGRNIRIVPPQAVTPDNLRGRDYTGGPGGTDNIYKYQGQSGAVAGNSFLTSFGGGGGGSQYTTNRGAGGGSFFGDGGDHANYAGGGGASYGDGGIAYNANPTPNVADNTGGGSGATYTGSGTGNGGSGYAIIYWYE